MRKIISKLFLVFTIIVLVYCIYIVAQSKKTGKEVFILGYKPYIIQTGSMEPTLKVNSLIIVKNGEFEKVQPYDIISFNLSKFSKNVCHRVIAIENNEMITKGDNNNNPDDGIVTKENYVGRVVFNTNITSYLISYFKAPGKLIQMVIVVTILIGIIIAIKILSKNNYKGKRSKE